jgi:hypothetical protein
LREALGDFTTSVVALALLRLIGLFTNLFYFGRCAANRTATEAAVSPARRQSYRANADASGLAMSCIWLACSGAGA